MRYIILLLMFIGPLCQAKVVADSMLMNGFINVDYFPDKLQKEQYNIQHLQSSSMRRTIFRIINCSG